MGASNLKLILIGSSWDCSTFHNFLSVSKKKEIKKEILSMRHKKCRTVAQILPCCGGWGGPLSILIFNSWPVCDWLVKWLIMLGFVVLRLPRVSRHSNIGFVLFSVHFFLHLLIVKQYCHVLLAHFDFPIFLHSLSQFESAASLYRPTGLLFMTLLMKFPLDCVYFSPVFTLGHHRCWWVRLGNKNLLALARTGKSLI